MHEQTVRFHVQWTTSVAGLALIAFGIYNGVTTDDWNVWSVVASLGPIGLGIALALPGPVERTLDILAPKISFLDDNGDDNG